VKQRNNSGKRAH